MPKIFIGGEWWDRDEWEKVTQTNWWGLSAATLGISLLIGGGIALVIIFWAWVSAWVPVILGVAFVLIVLVAGVAEAIERRP